jgi:hypothetical protein
LLGAEISFLIASAALIGFYVTQIHFLPRQVSVLVDTLSGGFAYPPQGCSSGAQPPQDLTTIIDQSSFTVPDWTSTIPSSLPLFHLDNIHHVGPSALVDDHAVAPCFSFAGRKGGGFLVPHPLEYHISWFTLNNSVIDPVAGGSYYPKEGALWGLFEGTLPKELKGMTTSFVTEGAIYVLIGNFCFDPARGPVQTFSVDEDIAALPAVKFSVFYIEILSNWGGSYTCICRLQLHGNQ